MSNTEKTQKKKSQESTHPFLKQFEQVTDNLISKINKALELLKTDDT